MNWTNQNRAFAGAYLFLTLSCLMGCSAVESEPESEIEKYLKFEKIEAGDPESDYASIDLNANYSWVITLSGDISGSTRLERLLDQLATRATIELTIFEDRSGLLQKYEGDEMIDSTVFTSGYISSFDLFDARGTIRASVRPSEVVLVDSNGKFRIQLHKTGMIIIGEEREPDYFHQWNEF